MRIPKAHPSVMRRPAEKPVELLEWVVSTYSRPGEIVLDPACGTGAAAIACSRLGRRCLAIDADGEAVGLARARLASEPVAGRSRAAV